MHCIHCETGVPQGKFCPNCGKQQGIAATPGTEIKTKQPHHYKRIGGMFWYFVGGIISNLILIPIAIVMSFELYEGVTLVLELIGTTLIGLTVVNKILLLRRNPKFLTVFHITWSAIITWAIVCNVIVLRQEGTLTMGLLAIFTDGVFFSFWGMVLSVIVFVMWRIYFICSRRVRTYMGTDTYVTKCPFTSNSTTPMPVVPDA